MFNSSLCDDAKEAIKEYCKQRMEKYKTISSCCGRCRYKHPKKKGWCMFANCPVDWNR